jgi:hypothetical protein
MIIDYSIKNCSIFQKILELKSNLLEWESKKEKKSKENLGIK